SHAIAEKTVLRFLRQGRGTSPQAEHGDLARLSDEFCSLADLLRIQLSLRLRQSTASLAEDSAPERHSRIVASGRRFAQIKRSDDQTLRKLELEVADTIAADRTRDAGDCRFADPAPLRECRVGSIDREPDILEHDIGGPSLRWAQIAIGILY